MPESKNEQRDPERQSPPASGLSFAYPVHADAYYPKTLAREREAAAQAERDQKSKWDKFEALTQAFLAVVTLILLGIEGWYLYKQQKTLEQSVIKQAEAIQQTNIAIGQTQKLIEQQDAALGYARSQADSSEKAVGAAERGVKVASDTLVIGQRPWVLLRDIKGEPVAAGKPFKLTVRVHNYGASPALGMTGRARFLFHQTQPNPMPSSDLPESLIEIGAGKGADIPMFDQVISPEQLATIDRLRLTLYVWGRVEYTDIFKQRHVTRFCGFQTYGTPNFYPCKGGNYAD